MLSYALLIALLYSGDNKNLKTLLAIATALAMLKSDSPKKVRRPRNKRARRILAERALAKKERKEELLDKVQILLPIIIKALEKLYANSSNKTNAQSYGKNTRKIVNNTISKSEEKDARDERKNKEYKEAYATKEVSSLNDNHIGNINIIEEEEEQFKEPEIVYNTEDIWKKDRKRNIAEEIKEAFHGTDVNLTLKNGERLKGEVVGEYNGFLILESCGILKYVDGKDIESFS
ncbi:MAG: hypothetical protein GX895_02230 [Clostridiales bacterium]|uniref:hypothetical protein n=1 Tax=Clostridium sp. N3C TaxID=1776758 RepID=UPI00092E1D4F|nr:hypothetical protein [Clostridium sp. N3C]NLZ47601.1 hypothetical protein [Clostridiales bacterium]SCN23566.1 hypothetical protein N3C_1366 [Clostridium sp. N3C]